MRVLFASSEAYPFIKTGGLGDIAYSLPRALRALDVDVQLLLPGYRDVLDKVEVVEELDSFELRGHSMHQASLKRVIHPEEQTETLLLDVPALFDRAGNPYLDSMGSPWHDNTERYVTFCRAIAHIASGVTCDGWRPDVVHSNDWQTALASVFVNELPNRPATIYTIHNMAYDGGCDYQEFESLGMPAHWWTHEGVEFYGGLSMMKAGITYADRVNTVSPTYAREIMTPEFGYRFDAVLRHHADKVSGILNGIDEDVWNPESDDAIAAHYSASRNRARAKLVNKRALLREMGLKDTDQPVFGFIGRLVEQKGIDLILDMLPQLFDKSGAVLVVLGSGEARYEQALQQMVERYPERVAIRIGYSEELAHRIEAGSDLFLMPSRFEPCGLNQMYSLRYGTPPVVNNTGGLSDTVVNTTLASLRDKTANGFVFYEVTPAALLEAALSATQWYERKRLWQQICRTGMQADHGWNNSARAYLDLYNDAMKVNA